MNERLMQEHKARLSKPQARQMYDQLCQACEERPGGMDDVSQGIVGDVAMLEEMKLTLYEDVAKRGATISWHNGRQSGVRENKSIQQARMLMEQQRKHLSELKLTPASQKRPPDTPEPVAAQTPEDEFDAFPDS
ncbi:MAG: P27 family phage terminase small subunit [Clostridiales bacterium]|nr:P27 family phage terminase small subunit [Clostridiales bacterium]